MAFGNKENSKKWSQRVLIISWNWTSIYDLPGKVIFRDNLPGKSNPLFRHKGAIDHTLHLSVMHIFYNIHIHPRIFQFLVCTVGDLSFDQLKRLLGNRTVDMWLDIGHHFLICIALPERYFKILNGYTYGQNSFFRKRIKLWNLFLVQSGSRTSKIEVLKSFWFSDFLHT